MISFARTHAGYEGRVLPYQMFDRCRGLYPVFNYFRNQTLCLFLQLQQCRFRIHVPWFKVSVGTVVPRGTVNAHIVPDRSEHGRSRLEKEAGKRGRKGERKKKRRKKKEVLHPVSFEAVYMQLERERDVCGSLPPDTRHPTCCRWMGPMCPPRPSGFPLAPPVKIS